MGKKNKQQLDKVDAARDLLEEIEPADLTGEHHVALAMYRIGDYLDEIVQIMYVNVGAEDDEDEDE